MTDVFLVSGADEKYFVMAGMLADSLAERLPELPFRLMDLGLSESQREFARRQGWLLPVPAGLRLPSHPFLLKAAMGRYLKPIGEGDVVWIDSDVVAVADGARQVAEQLAAMARQGQSLAVTPEAGTVKTVGQFIRHSPAPKFERMVKGGGLDEGLPYINSGVIFIRDRDALDSWLGIAETYEGDVLFEQNAFNLLAHRRGASLGWIDPRTWNNHGKLLGEIRMQSGEIRCQERPVLLLHPTSNEAGDVDKVVTKVTTRGLSLDIHLKLLRSPMLREIQKRHLNRFLNKNFTMLADCGVLRPSDGGSPSLSE